MLQPFCWWFYDPGYAMLEVKQGLRVLQVMDSNRNSGRQQSFLGSVKPLVKIDGHREYCYIYSVLKSLQLYLRVNFFFPPMDFFCLSVSFNIALF